MMHLDWQWSWSEGFLGNSWERWALFGAIIFGTYVISVGLRFLVVKRLRRIAATTVTRLDDMLLAVLEKTRLSFLLILGIHLGLHVLELHPKVARASEVIFLIALFAQLGAWLTSGVTFFGHGYTRDALKHDAAHATTVTTMIFLGQVAIWATMALLLVGNLGYNVSALLAGLGVGGIAIALAVQNILGDLFGSLSIVLDKPFVIGDFIAVDNDMGKVEHIGLKTTRVKSLTGEQLVLSNSDLLKSRIRNYKRMEERRVEFTFGLQYYTPQAQLDRVRQIVQGAVEHQPDCRFERCHLAKFGNLGLEFECVYWVKSRDYLAYVSAHHHVATEILAALRREKILMAYAPSAAPPPEENANAQRPVRT